MTAKNVQRTYNSPLREQQAERTRERIIEAFAEQIVDRSLEDFSIARVAKAAGVASRTVYHYFPNRESILAAMQEWFDRTVTFPPIPTSVEGLSVYLGELYRSMEANGTLLRAILASDLAGTVRGWSRPNRRRAAESIVRSISDDLTEEQVRRGTGLLHYLLSIAAWRSLRDESGMDGEQVAEALTWAVMTLVRDLEQEAGRNKPSPADEGAEE